MTDDTRAALRKRITTDPAVLVGKPVIRGMRISVAQIVEAVAAADPQSELLQLLDDYPGLKPEDIQAALGHSPHSRAGGCASESSCDHVAPIAVHHEAA